MAFKPTPLELHWVERPQINPATRPLALCRREIYDTRVHRIKSGVAVLDTVVLVIIAIAIITMLGLFRGVVQAFKRQPVVAALFLIFLFPVFFVWVVAGALFLDSPE